MTIIRAELVCESCLYGVALNIGLCKHLRLGRGAKRTGEGHCPSILADMVEAIIAAMYLDSGMEQSRRFVLEMILKDAPIDESHTNADYKTRLQELVQRKSDQHISYTLTGESGPDHNKLFSFSVSINGVPAGEGSGRTKKEAEQMAAMKALEALTK